MCVRTIPATTALSGWFRLARVPADPACHAGGRGFESRRSRLLERLQIGRLRCQNRHGDSLGGPIPWAKRLRQNACKIPISCGDLVSGGTNESRSRARHRGSSSGVAADRRTRPDHHRRPRASPSGTFSEPTAHTGRLRTWDCQSHVLTSVRGLTGLADDSSVVTVVAGASLEPEDLLERCRPCVIDAVHEVVGHPVLPALADGLIREKALGRFAIICLEVPEDARAGQRTSAHRRRSASSFACASCSWWGSVPAVTLSPSDIDAIRAAEKALAEAFEAPDPTAWVDFYTEDVIFAGPGVPTIQGRADFLEAARETVISSMQITAESTLGSGDFAAMFGRATWVSGPRGSDAPVRRRRLLMVWRREPDGRWRIARELLNEDP